MKTIDDYIRSIPDFPEEGIIVQIFGERLRVQLDRLTAYLP